MVSAPPRGLRDALVALALLVPTLLFVVAQLGLEVDIENRSLKSPDSTESVALARRIEQFGPDLTVVAAFRAVPEGVGTLTRVELDSLEALRKSLLAEPAIARIQPWPSRSDSSVVWAIDLAAPGGNFAPSVAALEGLLAARTPPTLRSSLSGLAVGEVVIAREVRAEQGRVLPLVVAGFVALLLVHYRRLGLVLAILAPAGIAILWTSGIFALLGRQLDPISVMLQPVLLTVGVAAGVHWVEAYLDGRRLGLEARHAAEEAVLQLRRPALLAALTTVVGFLSLAFSSIPAVIDFGVFAALGVALTYALAATLTPIVLGRLARDVPTSIIERRRTLSELFGRRVADWLAARALAIRACALLIALGGLALWPHVQVDNDPQRVLPREHEFRRESERIARFVGGSDVFDVLVPAGSPLADPAALALFGASLSQEPGIAGPAGYPRRSDGGDSLLRFLLKPSGSTQREQLFERVEARAVALGAPQVRVTGASVQVARDSGRLIRSAFTGTLMSLATLFVLFWAGFRSLRYALLAMVPNILPCIVVYAALAALGRPLSVATAMISSVLLGLIVDDTIHLLHRFREARQRGASRLAALEGVYQHSGRAVLITSVVLGLGFSIGMFGELSTTSEFCGMAAITIVVALLCDVLLLPALLIEARPAEVARG